MTRVAVAAVLLLGLGGCVSTIAGAAYDAVTLPVRVVGAGINAVVPSQKKADQKRGKRARKAEEAQRKADKKAARDAERGTASNR